MNEHPKLDLPGAGLPWLETFFLRNFYYPSKLHKSTWRSNLDRLRNETNKIITICDSLNEQQFQTRILIPRLKGMEDSSRFWSVGLAIQHLLVTMEGMTHIAFELAQSRNLAIKVDTAQVKPKQEDVTKKDEMLRRIENKSDMTIQKLLPFQENASKKFKVGHPFFGPITAEGWVWVIGQHQSLHRKQIQMISERL